jgi:AraC-like DNA-binding protein
MIYLEKLPNAQLSQYIDKFWYCQADSFANKTLVIPLLHHELIFNFSDYHCISRNPELGTVVLRNPTSWISGIQTAPTIVESKGKHKMMGVLFKPNGLKRFTKYHSKEFENSHVEAELIFGNPLNSLIDQLHAKREVKDKFNIIQNFLTAHLMNDTVPHYLNESLKHFSAQTQSRISIKTTSSKVLTTNKSLINSFQKHIGVTPIKYLRLQSINAAIKLLTKDPLQSYTNLANELNFYDQAHFINAFKQVTGLTPTQYSRYVLSDHVDKSSSNFIQLWG